MNSFPIPVPGCAGRARAVGVEAVFAWLRFGWKLFMADPVVWVASVLILLAGMPPVKACKASFAACWKNIPPFLILGLIVFVLAFLAAPPAGLGFPVLIPVLAGTACASYQDVFVAH
ncbi:MAG: hypothetical protein LBS49_13605 [Candidatus Accumulibacter sp.]|jgi:uncharacterized membrane protein|nr:hypothetical protein [Accumulibacter sp.]